MQIFYVNIGGGEPTVRPDFWELLDYAVEHHVGVKFSTNGFRITPERAGKLAATDYVDVQISLDGATAEVNDAVRGPGTYDAAMRAMGNLQDAGMRDFKMSVVCTRHNIGQLDEFKAIADRYGAQLRLTRLRPSGRGADVWERAAPAARAAARALRLAGRPRRRGAHRRLVLPPVGLRRRAAGAEPLRRRARRLPGRPGRATCTRVRSPSTTPSSAGNVRADGGFGHGLARLRRSSPSCARPQTGGACTRCSAYDSCRGGCMAAKFFTGLPLDGPDPECVKGHGADGARRRGGRARHRAGTTRTPDRSAARRSPLTLQRRPPDRACDESPLAGLARAAEAPSTAPRRGPRAVRPAGPVSGGRVAERGRCVLVPVGSVEQHGPHLPLATDAIVADAVARAAARAPGGPRGTGAGRARRCLRRQRRARGLPGHHLDRPRGAAPAARRARPVGLPVGGRAWSSSTATAATRATLTRPSSCCATRAGRWRGPRATCRAPTRTPGEPRPRCCCTSPRTVVVVDRHRGRRHRPRSPS